MKPFNTTSFRFNIFSILHSRNNDNFVAQQLLNSKTYEIKPYEIMMKYIFKTQAFICDFLFVSVMLETSGGRWTFGFARIQPKARKERYIELYMFLNKCCQRKTYFTNTCFSIKIVSEY